MGECETRRAPGEGSEKWESTRKIGRFGKYGDSASLPTQPLSCCSTHFGTAWFMEIVTWRRRGKKPLTLHEITNTPGPVLRPALRQYENRARCSNSLLSLNFLVFT